MLSGRRGTTGCDLLSSGLDEACLWLPDMCAAGASHSIACRPSPLSAPACPLLQVVQNPAAGPVSPRTAAWAWSVLLTASAGLCMLYKTTTCDPGFLPARGGKAAARANAASRSSLKGSTRYAHQAPG